MVELPFNILLYRYFFFDWLFQDANKGNVYERSVAWRHNKIQARWLPTYLRRWLFLSSLTFMLGGVCELLLRAPILSAFFFVPMAACVCVNTLIGALILAFKSLSGPL